MAMVERARRYDTVSDDEHQGTHHHRATRISKAGVKSQSRVCPTYLEAPAGTRLLAHELAGAEVHLMPELVVLGRKAGEVPTAAEGAQLPGERVRKMRRGAKRL